MDDRTFIEVARIEMKKWANQCQRIGRKWQKQDELAVDNSYFMTAK